MATSVNGWPLVPAGSPQLVTLPGVPTGPVALGGPVATLLGHVAAEFHARVETVTSTSSHRPGATIGSTGRYSNHASATAVDLNGGRHPQFRRGTFTAAQVAQIRVILSATKVIDWGGDWGDASVDEMHFEIRPGTTAQQAAAAADALNPPAPPTEEDMPLTDTDIAKIWGVKPTGTSTFGEMLMHTKMRLSNGTAPQAAGLSEVAALRKEMLAGFAEIKKALGS